MSLPSRDALRTALLYALLSMLWLELSHVFLPQWTEDPTQLAHWQLINGYLWASFSAVLMCFSRSPSARLMGGGTLSAQQELDQHRLRQAAVVFDSTREGVLVTDQQGLIVHVNRAFMEITGYQQTKCSA